MNDDAKNDWWDFVEGTTLEQGHYLSKVYLPRFVEAGLLALSPKHPNAPVKFEIADAITLTQSCDYDGKRVLVAKVIGIEEARTKQGQTDEKLQVIRDGGRPHWLMLSGPNDPLDKEDCLLVDFRTTVPLPKAYVEGIAKTMGQRPVLRSPYIEYLSHGFGRYFSRVALPSVVPTFVQRVEEDRSDSPNGHNHA